MPTWGDIYKTRLRQGSAVVPVYQKHTVTSFLNSFLKQRGDGWKGGWAGVLDPSKELQGWVCSWREGVGRVSETAHSVGVPFSDIFIFGTAREPAD